MRGPAGLVAVGAGRERLLLALLLLRPGEPVSTERLIDALWGEQPPKSAANSVHVYVSHLRRALGDGRLRTSGRGYVLDVAPGELDASEFERLAAEGRELRGAGDPRAAAEALSRALALWRGAPLTDVPPDDSLRDAAGRLEDLRLETLEELAEARLELGANGGLVTELESLIRANPYRERLHALLMLALYRSGRQADALDVYRNVRRVLREELGLEPGPELQQLQRAILEHDPALGGTPKALALARRRGGLLLVAAAVLLLAVTAVVALELRGGDAAALQGLAPNSVGVVDLASGSLAAQVPVGIGPGRLAAADGSIWAANGEDGTISRIDARTRQLRRTIPLDGTPVGVAAGNGAVWAVTAQGGLFRLDPRFDTAAKIATVRQPGALYADTLAGVASGFSSLWVTDSLGLVYRLDHRGRLKQTFDAGFGASALAVGAGAVWVANQHDGTVSRIDLAGTKRIAVGGAPADVAVGAGGVWVADSLDDEVDRIDPAADRVAARIPVGRNPASVAVAGGSVWVGDRQGGDLLRIDARTNRVAGSVPVGSSPTGLTATGGSLWISAGPRPPAAASSGGVLRVEVDEDPGPLDPASVGTPLGFQLAYLTCARLMNYLDRPAPEGSRAVPEVAASAPTRSDDGRRYTFVVRGGFRFSPPSGEPVTARTFKEALERLFDPRVVPNAPDLSDVVGMDAFRAGRAPHVTGIVARGRRLTFRLKQPLGDLPERLSAGTMCAVPRGAPVGRPLVLPAAGPYYVASYVAGQELVLRRNPNYSGPRPHGPSEIDVRIGISQQRAVADVEAGRADYAAGGVPAGDLARLRARYGSGRDRRFFVNPTLNLRMLVLNTSRPLFSDARLRQAAAYAIDRSALAAQEQRYFHAGQFSGGAATDAYLPDAMPGAPRPGTHPLAGGDLARARGLAGDAGAHRRAVLYTCNTPPCTQEAAIVRADLRRIGIDVEVDAFSKPVMYGRAGRPDAPFDILTIGWYADYADPGNFLGPLLTGSVPDDRWSANYGHFQDPSFTPRLRAAARLSGTARYASYGRLAQELARDSSPLVVYESDEAHDFFAARVGCQVYQPVWGMDLAALCLR